MTINIKNRTTLMKKVLPQTVQRESYKGGNGRYAQQGSHFRVCRRTETSNLLRMAALKAYGLSEPEEWHKNIHAN
jgi:hypothetical protein